MTDCGQPSATRRARGFARGKSSAPIPIPEKYVRYVETRLKDGAVQSRARTIMISRSLPGTARPPANDPKRTTRRTFWSDASLSTAARSRSWTRSVSSQKTVTELNDSFRTTDCILPGEVVCRFPPGKPVRNIVAVETACDPEEVGGDLPAGCPETFEENDPTRTAPDLW